MIEVRVKVILGIISLVGGHREQMIQMDDDSNVANLIEKLTSMYGEQLKNNLFNGNGEINFGFAVFLNGRNIFALDGLNTKLRNDDELLIFPPVGGG